MKRKAQQRTSLIINNASRKKGKSTEQLNNLRPITLTNCDLKITTKTFANRMSKLLEEVINFFVLKLNFHYQI